PPRPPTLRQRPRPPRAPIGLATKAFRGIAGAALAALLAAAQGLGRGWRALRPPMADAWRAVTSALRARAVPAASRSPQGRRSPRVRLDLPAGPTRAKGSTATMAASRSAPPSARLTVLEGPLAGKAFHLRPDAAVTIGPGPDCDIVLGAAPGVTAARIARIWPREDRFMLHVLASELPAFVQDHPLVWVVLEDGDLLELGPYRLRFEVIR
ncbi:MAG TPA: FHA domain-containing protein, partial [Dehalococcoidia bacterium]|nr:FHA domain-containing protein [Dehalococcoidia bacterium]